ncbi:hypothetical protein GF373_00270 [bacterium]|nr:hypothetical protein [bacterium]
MFGNTQEGTAGQVSGVFPDLAMVADHQPRTEAGTGALLPWADRLWVVTYVAHMKGTGSGTGLYEIDVNEDGKLQRTKRPESVVGTYANRMVHAQSNQIIIGPHIIDTEGNVRTINAIKNHRLTATMEHLTDPKNKVYFLAMEGEFFEVNVHTLEAKELYQLTDTLAMPAEAKPHFKGGFTAHGRVVVANNTYDARDYNESWQAGRLAEWDGYEWTILDKNPYTEVWSSKSFGNPLIATGWDNRSVILKVHMNKKWHTYRLPKASHTYDHTSNTEWMRIREVETERALMDCHGMFYELPYHTYDNKIWGIRPVCTHLRVIPDFCSWRGMLVCGGNQSTPMKFGGVDRNLYAGQPQAGLWFGKTDDLWSFGKPKGTGGVWRNTKVKADEISDPFLMRGFDKKVLHLKHDLNQPVWFTIEVDFLGNGTWEPYKTIKAVDSYAYHVFPNGFSAEWVRIKVSRNCNATAYFIYS